MLINFWNFGMFYPLLRLYMQREQDFYGRSILIPSDDVAHTHWRKTTHTLHAVPWVGRVWASKRVKSVSLRSTYLASRHIVCFMFWLIQSNKRHWIIWVACLYFTWELNKVYTVTEDPTRYPGIVPSTVQPQHICW